MKSVLLCRQNYLFLPNQPHQHFSEKLVHILRMLTAPPIARDRLSGLASVNKSLIEKMEQGKLPRTNQEALHNGVSQIITVIGKNGDRRATIRITMRT